jgi:hypothetical protein
MFWDLGYLLWHFSRQHHNGTDFFDGVNFSILAQEFQHRVNDNIPIPG